MTLDLHVSATAFLIAFITVLVLGPRTIAALHRLKYDQTVNADVAQHAAKQGTPTMGGVLFLFGMVIALAVTLVWFPVLRERGVADLAAVVAVFVLHMLLGFADDYLSIKRGKNLGLKARQKLAAQFIIALAFGFYVLANSPADLPAREVLLLPGTWVQIPLVLYAVIAACVMVMMSNFTNLTDGLDGLASGLSLLVFVGLALYAAHAQIGVFGWAIGGALLGFLIYNGNPARVFMGDTGSLALGSAMTAMAVLSRCEILYIILALVFIAEGVSVVLQVASFKSTGKRIFQMAPLHHHFELIGWKETQIVLRFWIAGAICFWLGMLYANRMPAP